MDITNAINRVIELDQTITTEEIDGRLYSKSTLRRIPKSDESQPVTVGFCSLAGISDFAKELVDEGLNDTPFFHVDSQSRVTIVGRMQPGNMNTRFTYAEAVMDLESFIFSNQRSQHWYDLELFVISLQSLFVHNEALEQIIDMLGSVANNAVMTHADDGFSQSIQIRTGITTRENSMVKNPCTLKPYRTFREVDQPESNFILRLRKEGEHMKASMWESDGGAWRGEAMKNIKSFLEDKTNLTAIA